MPPAAFVDPDALARAKREHAGPGGRAPHPSHAALRASVERALALPPERLLHTGGLSNLFITQTALLELSLLAALEDGGPALDGLRRALGGLTEPQEILPLLPGEVYPAFVMIGAAVALELGGRLLDDEALLERVRETIAFFAERLERGAAEEPWGEQVVRRLAWNHAIVAFAALGVAGHALPAHPRAAAWRELARERTLLFFEHGLTASGMTREGISYCGFVFRNLGFFLGAARRGGELDYLDPHQNPSLQRLRLVPEWYAGEVFPGGRWTQALNDSYPVPTYALGGWLSTFLPLRPQLAASFWDRTVGAAGSATWGFDSSLRTSTVLDSVLHRPAEPVAAATGPALFVCDDVGYLRERDERRGNMFSFNCGPFLGSIHDQADNNSFTVFASGVPVVIDAGAFNVAEEGNPSSSYGHSAIVIDGLGQHPCGGGYGVSGTLEVLERDGERTIVAGDATASYGYLGYNPVRWARRWCVWAGGETPYLLVYDDIEKDDSERRYELLLHTPQTASFRADGSRASAVIDFEGRAVTATLQFASPAAVSITTEPFENLNNAPLEHHLLWRAAATAANPHFVAVLSWNAHPPADAPEVHAEIRSDAAHVTVACGERRDTIQFPRRRQGDGGGSPVPLFRRQDAVIARRT
jgi:hypothetical protein